MVPTGNPKKIRSLRDVVDKQARLINRQPHSGTRELLGVLLQEQSIRTNEVIGFDQYEYTHSAVAAQVATGMADVGFGMQAAAARFDLDFIPITEDLYLWAIRSDSIEDPEVSRFIEMLATPDFQKEVNELPGYECDGAGHRVALKQLL
jgi:molybdate-binding protein